MESISAFLKSTPNVVKNTVADYFAPHKTILDTINTVLAKPAKPSLMIQPSNFMRLINKFVCYNQGAFIQYSFLAGERHKELKDEFKKKNPNKKKINFLIQELINYLNHDLFKNTSINFKYLHYFF